MTAHPFRAVNTPKIRLYNLVVDALRAHGLNPIKTMDAGVLDAVRHDPELLGELMDFNYQEVRDALHKYELERVSEIRGLPLGIEFRRRENERFNELNRSPVTFPTDSRTGSNAGAGAVGQTTGDTQVILARPPASDNPPVAQPIGLRENSSPIVVAPPLTIEDRLRGAARHSESILQTLIIGGRPIGEWYAGDAKKRAEITKYETRVLEIFSQGVPDNKRIGDVLTDAEAARCFALVHQPV